MIGSHTGYVPPPLTRLAQVCGGGGGARGGVGGARRGRGGRGGGTPGLRGGVPAAGMGGLAGCGGHGPVAGRGLRGLAARAWGRHRSRSARRAAPGPSNI
eukprot:9504006-Pyramimonas_sp.AAC.1